MTRTRLIFLSVLLLGVAAMFAQQIGVLLAGGNPLASPIAATHDDQPYAESPLATALAIESSFARVDADGVLAFADEMAEELGWYALTRTGASDLQAAEVAIWADAGMDAFANRFATALRDRQVYSRKVRRLSAGVPDGVVYVHPDELVLLFAHVAWRLDLRTDLVRSPEHHYILWRSPDDRFRRGIEPTCFRCVDALGKVTPSQEPAVGRRLTFSPDFFSSGVGGIRNPDPLPPGAYEVVTAEALPGDLLARLAARHDLDNAALAQHLDGGPAIAQALWSRHIERGLQAYASADRAALVDASRAATALRDDHAAVLPATPDHQVLQAAVKRDVALLKPVFDAYEPDGPVLLPVNDAHATAMWLDLRHGRIDEFDWNARIIPLMNRHRDDPERFAELCGYGRRALRDVKQSLDELMPRCVED